MPKLLEGIRDILRKHPKEKGLIHTHKWELNDQVMAIGDPRFITHTRNGNGKDEEIRQFLSSKNGVFVSPSSSRGLDLPDDACRFIILAKAPYMDLKDKLVSSRYYTPGGIGRHWYQFMAAQDIVQASGRGVRHRDDYCATYLLDKGIEKLIADNAGLFPQYWRERSAVAVNYF